MVEEIRPLSIFQILDKNEFSTGSVHQMFQAAVGLRERGHAVSIVSRDDSTLAGKAREHGVDFFSAPFSSEVDLRTISMLRKLLQTRRPDVIHVHKGRPHTLALAASWFSPVPAFVVNRGVSFPLTLWNRPKYRTGRVDRVVTVCEQIRQVVVSSGRLSPEKVDVVYAGTDMAFFDREKYDPLSFRTEKRIPLDRFVITQVGVRDWKGWRELIRAFSDVHRRNSLTHLVLVGCRTEQVRREVEVFAQACSVADAVSAVEVRDDIPSVFAASDCIADASWAGTGITGTVREGMAMGKPVVATDCGGNVELVSSPQIGWLVPPRDQDALTRALLEVLENPSHRMAVGDNAMHHVRSSFSKDVRITRLENLYREIIRSKALKPRPLRRER